MIAKCKFIIIIVSIEGTARDIIMHLGNSNPLIIKVNLWTI